jgi:hypothetical protein
MRGVGYRCNECKRITFVEEVDDDAELAVPSPGWLGVSEVPADGAVFSEPLHFCSWVCNRDYANKQIGDEDRPLHERQSA